MLLVQTHVTAPDILRVRRRKKDTLTRTLWHWHTSYLPRGRSWSQSPVV